jgi:hypothetical protein
MVDRRTLRRIGYGIEALATQALGKATRMIWMEEHEIGEEAIARYLAEHPEAAGYEFLVAGWLPTGSAMSPRPPPTRKAYE